MTKVYKLNPLAPLTGGIASGSLQGPGDGRLWMTPKAGDADWGSPSTSGRTRERSTHLTTQAKMWPTPVANDDNKSPAAHMAMKARMKGGPRYKPTSLNVMVKGVEMGLWPTPTVDDASHCGGKSRVNNMLKGQYQGLNAFVVTALKEPHGSLNPTWVSVLMGYPPNWTEVD